MIKNPDTVNPLVLAWIGDARYGAYIRARLVLSSDAKVDSLQRRANAYVSARAQAVLFDRIEAELTTSEADAARRARNAHSGHVAKNASIAEYKKATALEAVFGYLHLCGESEREEALLKRIYELGETL